MPDARDAARAWLAERFHVAQCGCSGADPWEMELRLAHLLADAILSASGVEVDSVELIQSAGKFIEADGGTHTQVVIRLPATPIEGDDQSPA